MILYRIPEIDIKAVGIDRSGQPGITRSVPEGGSYPTKKRDLVYRKIVNLCKSLTWL